MNFSQGPVIASVFRWAYIHSQIKSNHLERSTPQLIQFVIAAWQSHIAYLLESHRADGYPLQDYIDLHTQ